MARRSVVAVWMMLMVPIGAAADGSPGRLEPCPDSPNCVSTQAERSDQRMDPIPYRGDLEQARQRLLTILENEPRVTIESTEGRRIATVFTTRLLRFKDDVVFLFDPEARVIHFRSASRLGRSDFGTNRERMERLSKAFLDAEAPGSR